MTDLIERAATFLMQHSEPELCNAVIAQADEIERLQKRIKFIYTSSNGDLYAEIERLRIEQGQYEEELERLRAVVEVVKEFHYCVQPKRCQICDALAALEES